MKFKKSASTASPWPSGSLHAVLTALALALIVASGFLMTTRTHAAGTMALSGYAWSSNVGWISFKGTATNGSTYGVVEDTTSGALSGYAWSSNIGWISFNAADSSHPAPKVDFNNAGAISGWVRACSAFSNKNACSGSLDPNSGGWDGWIDLSGTASNGSTYGLKQASNCAWSGYAWGSESIGWISFKGTATNGSTYGVVGTNTSVCSQILPTATLSASPSSVDSGQTATLSWTSTKATSCTSTGGFSTGGATSGSATVGPLTSSTNYQIYCDGPGGRTYSSVQTITLLQPITLSITASPTRVVSGEDTTLSWSSTNASSCTVTDPSGTVATGLSGTKAVAVTAPTTYTLTCQSGSTAATTQTATQVTKVKVVPKYNQF